MKLQGMFCDVKTNLPGSSIVKVWYCNRIDIVLILLGEYVCGVWCVVYCVLKEFVGFLSGVVRMIP